MRKLLLAFLLLSVLGNPASARQSDNDLPMKQKQCFSDKCRALGLHNPQFFYQHKINISKAKDFRKNGVDLQQMSRRWNGFTPLEQTLLVPYVVKAKVVGIEDAPASLGQFRVVYSLKIDKTISGEKLPDKIQVHSRSHGGNGSFFSFNNEPVLQLGEEVVLYLNEMAITPREQKPRKPGTPIYEEISMRPALEKEPQRIFIATLKYTVKKGQLLDAWNRPFAKEDEFTKLAGKLFKINQQKKFFKRSYC